MIKFVLAIPRYLVSSQLKAIQQLKINRQQYQPLEIKQKLWDLLQQVPHEEIHQFIDVYKEFDYDSKEIAEFYNKQLDAQKLILQRHFKIEAAKVIDSAYLHILKNDSTLKFRADFDLESIGQYLNENGLATILAQTQKDTLFRAYHKIIQNTFYGLYFETLKPETKQVRLLEIIKNMESDLLKDNDPSNVIWKTYLFTMIQGSNKQIINHFAKVITKTEKFTNKEIIILTQILQTLYTKFGSDSSITEIIRKLNHTIYKQQEDLHLDDKICLLAKCTKDFDIQNKQIALCKPIYQKIREIPSQYYAQVFYSLCNHFWNEINLVEEEEFIDNNLQLFNDTNDLISIVYGLIYAESQNTQLIKTVLAKILQLANLNNNATQCSLYQIIYVLQKLYNIKYEVQDIDKMKSTYFNGTNFKSSPSFSHVNLELLETLQQIKDDLSNQKRPDWKITQIKKEVTVGIYTIDFVVEIEGIYKKKLVYLDFLQRNAFISNDKLTGRQRLRKNMLKNENVTFINYYDWHQAQNKQEFVRQLLVI